MQNALMEQAHNRQNNLYIVKGTQQQKRVSEVSHLL